MAARIRVVLEAFYELRDLVNCTDSGWCTLFAWFDGFPAAPLLAVDRTQLAVFIRPVIPDGDAVFLEVSNVSAALQEPQ